MVCSKTAIIVSRVLVLASCIYMPWCFAKNAKLRSKDIFAILEIVTISCVANSLKFSDKKFSNKRISMHKHTHNAPCKPVVNLIASIVKTMRGMVMRKSNVE